MSNRVETKRLKWTRVNKKRRVQKFPTRKYPIPRLLNAYRSLSIHEQPLRLLCYRLLTNLKLKTNTKKAKTKNQRRNWNQILYSFFTDDWISNLRRRWYFFTLFIHLILNFIFRLLRDLLLISSWSYCGVLFGLHFEVFFMFSGGTKAITVLSLFDDCFFFFLWLRFFNDLLSGSDF